MTNMKRIELEVDVGQASGLGSPTHSAAWVFLPPVGRLSTTGTVLYCLHGGSYTKAYYHMTIDGYEGYSFAEYFADRGYIVVAIDHLGMGDSAHPSDAGVLTPQVVAAANHAVVNAIQDKLRQGTLDSGLPPLDKLHKIGVGHSMGGFLLVHQQYWHRSFDALVNLAGPVHPAKVSEGLMAANREVDIPVRPEGGPYRHYLTFPRAVGRSMFHMPDVPESVVAFDDSLAVPTPAPLLDGLAHQKNTAAESIDVPLFLCYGEIDGSPDPYGEVAYYTNARDITLFILKGSAHCHNMATTRKELWDRMDRWISGLT